MGCRVACLVYSQAAQAQYESLPVQMELGALSSALPLTLQRSALCSVFVSDART